MFARPILVLLIVGALCAFALNEEQFKNLKCKANERKEQCGDLCDAKCGDGEFVACPEVCNPPACVCKDGFARDAKKNCIPKGKCPKK